MEEIIFRQATVNDAEAIWEILQEAILKRKQDGSSQWQNGYPNPTVIAEDIDKGFAYVMQHKNGELKGYIAIIDEVEPAYEKIDGKWLSNHEALVVHRLAVTQNNPVKGLGTWAMQEVEKVANTKNINSIKVDTNHDNLGMLRVFDKLGYVYCGEVELSGGKRKAFEKLIQ